MAKERGFRSRAYFKLLQIARKYQLLKVGDSVLDLGAAPGGWLQAIRHLVGDEGFILGVDVERIEQLPYGNIKTIRADVTAESISGQINAHAKGLFDVIVSDLAPNVTGVWQLDTERQIDLARHALRIAKTNLERHGKMLVKVFQGSETASFREEMKSVFRIVETIKPPASRPESAELFYLGLDFLGAQ